jgi:hypothetical protein
MKTTAKHLTWALLLTLGAGWTGYRVHQTKEAHASLPAGAVPSIECLAGPESFSRVDNAKNTLEALCLRLRLKAQNELVAIMQEPSASSQRRQALEPLIRQLEAGMHDFEGTEQELEFAQDLFVAYNCTAQFERWIDLYLMVSYRHPMHPVPLRLAHQALALGRQAGRLQDVLQALRHVNAIPFDFEGKDKVAAVLNRADIQRELTVLQHENHGS